MNALYDNGVWLVVTGTEQSYWYRRMVERNVGGAGIAVLPMLRVL
jgi:hypothetical protein